MQFQVQGGDTGEAKRMVRRAGFTLIEVMVVVIIIVVMASLIAPRFLKNVGKSRAAVTKANAASLKAVVDLFELEIRPLRSGDSLREVLWDGPSDLPDGSGWEPAVKSESALLDAWGKEFMLEVPGQKNIYDYDIVSYGSDGAPGGEGDAADIRE